MASLFALLSLTSPAAFAQDHSVGARIGLLGLGLEYGYRISERIAVRVGLNGSGIDYDDTESGIDYTFDLDFDSLSAGIDVYPTRAAFRVSVGLLKNDNELRATGGTSDSEVIGDDIYQPDEIGTLRGSIGFDDTAPFLALGWNFRHDRKIGVSLEFGLVDQGAPSVGLSADGSLASDPGFLADLELERRELEDDLDDLDVYPFAMLGIVYRF